MIQNHMNHKEQVGVGVAAPGGCPSPADPTSEASQDYGNCT